MSKALIQPDGTAVLPDGKTATREADKNFGCPYNPGCHCKLLECDTCGWHPLVLEKRRKESRAENYESQRMHVHKKPRYIFWRESV